MFHVEPMKKTPHLKVKDHLVSNQEFLVSLNDSTGILETIPRPSKEEIHKYYESNSYISHKSDKTTGINFIYKIIRKYSFKRKHSIIRGGLKANKINLLDVGCGNGDFLMYCEKLGCNVEGIENNKNALISSRMEKSLIVYNDFEQMQNSSNTILNNKRFDAITMWHSLEHLHDLDQVISNLQKSLSDKGVVLVACPNHLSYDAQYYNKDWAAYDAPRHLWHFNRASIQKLFAKHEMELVKVCPMRWDAFYISMLSEKIKLGRPNIIKAMYIGFVSNFKAMFTKEYSSLLYVFQKNSK